MDKVRIKWFDVPICKLSKPLRKKIHIEEQDQTRLKTLVLLLWFHIEGKVKIGTCKPFYSNFMHL